MTTPSNPLIVHKDLPADVDRTTYLQVRELLQRLQKSHKLLQRTYAEASAAVSDLPERSKMIVGYLERREAEVDAYLTRLSQEETEAMLDTWLQYTAFEEYERHVDELVKELPRDPEELHAQVAELDQEFLKHFESLAARSEAKDVHQFFAQLEDLACQRAKEHSEMLQQMEDI